MPERCVAALCSNVKNAEKGISMHKIPFYGEECPIKQKRRKKWIDFVLAKRKNWVPGKTSSLCSLHFIEEDFIRPFNAAGVQLKSELKKDDIGVCVFPTVHAKREGEDHEPPSKASREQRMVSRSGKQYLYSHVCLASSILRFIV